MRKGALQKTAPSSRFDRRTIEVALLALAAAPSFLLFLMADADLGRPIGLSTFVMPLSLAAMFAAVHIAIRIKAPDADPVILPAVYMLANTGLAFVSRLAPDTAPKQLLWMAVGAAALVAVLVAIPKLEKLAHLSYMLMAAGIVLMLTPMLPIVGSEVNGSRIWLALGPFSFQPGELAKILIILGLASYLAENREMLSIFTAHAGPFNFPDIRTLAPMLAMWGIAMLVIIAEKDFGTAMVFFFVFLMMLYVATGKKFYVIAGCALVAAGIAVLLPFLGHVQVRIDNWLDPFADPQGNGYQMVQSLYSMADGGLFGAGIGLGMCDTIPFVENDYIFSAIAEEAGMLGAACMLLLYLTLAIRGFLTAARAKTDFACFVAVGMVSMLVLQTFIIVGGICRVIPLTGITMPFVSQGGSSLLASFIAAGFLLRCGDEGTGIQFEMGSALGSLDKNGVLGRFALGKRLKAALVVLSVLYVVLVAALISIMFVHADEYKEMPGNSHTAVQQANVKRGAITTSDGVVLAASIQVGEGGQAGYVRSYPEGDLASQVVGYHSERYGSSGLESSLNGMLTGGQGNGDVTSVIDHLTRKKTAGNDVVLTLNARVQRAAQDALNGYTGACVVMDAASGEILAMASAPTYDAGGFEGVIVAAAEGSGDSSLLNRATQSRYAPGSTFKTVTLATALEEHVVKPDDVVSAPSEIEIGGGKVTNYNEDDLGDLTVAEAFALSSNTAFAQVGVLTGAEKLVGGAEKFGFGRELEFELPVVESTMPEAAELGEWELAWAADGQPVGANEQKGPYATVLQMAMTGAAIANDGAVMQPVIVKGTYGPNGSRISTAASRKLSQACSSDTARQVKEMMRGVVEHGTGMAAAIGSAQVYGKTGTAETGREVDDSWFVGFVEIDDRSYAIAMVLEEASAHGDGRNAASHCAPVLETVVDVML